ncbi:Serine/threonine-protein kinase 32B [Smittium culicis]|uniref:non-specific serine/threonine protein kinase n=1 Tax=Smittium culicis TaxID=133412 RepID=A0A1R1YMR8_9FUNG|nr:Serine/threonine-protein kinase 32B [Smittium culicis]
MKALDYILRERDLLEEIEHPYVVNLRFSFQSKATMFMVIDLMLGGDLRFHIDRKRFGERVIRHWMSELASGLAYLHNIGIIHRDIKPENVLMDNKGHIALTDFNVAVKVEPGTLSYATAGTMGYMAPEIIKGDGYSFAVDWWSLGVVMYECIYNCQPFPGENSNDICNQILYKKLNYPTFKGERISTECIQAMSMFLERDPTKRLDWHLLQYKLLRPPFVPDSDFSNFDILHELEEATNDDEYADITPKGIATNSKTDLGLKRINREFLNFDFYEYEKFRGYVEERTTNPAADMSLAAPKRLGAWKRIETDNYNKLVGHKNLLEKSGKKALTYSHHDLRDIKDMDLYTEIAPNKSRSNSTIRSTLSNITNSGKSILNSSSVSKNHSKKNSISSTKSFSVALKYLPSGLKLNIKPNSMDANQILDLDKCNSPVIKVHSVAAETPETEIASIETNQVSLNSLLPVDSNDNTSNSRSKSLADLEHDKKYGPLGPLLEARNSVGSKPLNSSSITGTRLGSKRSSIDKADWDKLSFENKILAGRFSRKLENSAKANELFSDENKFDNIRILKDLKIKEDLNKIKKSSANAQGKKQTSASGLLPKTRESLIADASYDELQLPDDSPVSETSRSKFDLDRIKNSSLDFDSITKSPESHETSFDLSKQHIDKKVSSSYYGGLKNIYTDENLGKSDFEAFHSDYDISTNMLSTSFDSGVFNSKKICDATYNRDSKGDRVNGTLNKESNIMCLGLKNSTPDQNNSDLKNSPITSNGSEKVEHVSSTDSSSDSNKDDSEDPDDGNIKGTLKASNKNVSKISNNSTLKDIAEQI